MTSATAVLVCLLAWLGRSEASFGRIELVDVAPPGVSANAEAFVRRGPDTIYLVTSSQVFRDAQRTGDPYRDRAPFVKLASVLAHEEWHLRHGRDERGAYLAQLTMLASLGVAHDSPLYQGVVRAMLAVVKQQERARRGETMLAAK